MAQLNFKGKQFVQNHHLAVKYHELIPHKDKSLTDKVSLHDNLIIHGDNLKALKALLPTYAGKIKCIYIDPPYNTGNEKWVYNDNVSSPMMQDWLGKVVDTEDLTRHDKWLCMMTPRLKLLRELLSEDGVIFISIDDNEQHRLRMLMDEIFGEENFLFYLVRKTKTSNNHDVSGINIQHEYVVVYAKNINNIKISGDKKTFLAYSNPDNDKNGDWISDNPSANLDGRKKINNFEIKNPFTGKIDVPPVGRHWSFNKETFDKYVQNGKIIFKKSHNPDERGFILKRYKQDVKDDFYKVDSLYFADNEYINQVATRDLYEFFENKIFEYSKPKVFIRKLISFSTEGNDIILDSFAGSGTTAHAVLDLNKEDGGNRKFILVEMEDYADKITAERVRRVIKGYSDKKGTGGTFSYFDLGKPIEMESILSGKNLPTFMELARYVFYTATGEEFDETKVNESKNFIGESKEYEVYLFYKPDLEYLKNTALTLDRAKALGPIKTKKRLVFAPTKYLDPEYLDEFKIAFAQLPFEIYKLSK